MAPPTLNELNTLTRVHILPGIVDNYFKAGPAIAWLKQQFKITFPGGSKIQENLIYAPMIGDAYKIGQTFNINRRQTKTGITFDMKYYEVSVPEYKEEVQVLIRGPEAVLDLVATDLGNAALTMSALLECDIYRNGQLIGATDRTPFLNGFEEAYTDQTNATFAGNTITSYGNQARVDVNSALNSPVGLIPANAGPAMSYRVLEHSYNSCQLGAQHPVMGITSNRGLGFVMEQFQPIQRVTMDTTEPTIGWPGIKFKQATLVASQYIPGQDGINDLILGRNYNNATELLIWLNPGKAGSDQDELVRLHIAADPEYQFGFTGFKVAQDSTIVVGKQLAALNFTARAPRLSRILFGFTK